MLARLEERDALIVQLKSEINILMTKVAILEVRLGKNSQDSSKPPFHRRVHQSPPRPCAGPSAGRRTSNTVMRRMRLEPAQTSDEVVLHEPDACERCGLDPADAPMSGERFQQVFDLPPIRLQIVEHRVLTRTCPCGHRTEAPFPPEATAMTCYGPRLQGLGAYLLHWQHLPVARTSELMADAFGAPVSTKVARLPGHPGKDTAGTIPRNGPPRNAERPGGALRRDGGPCRGVLRWVHVAGTSELTLLHLATGRSAEAIGSGGILGQGFARVAVHDGLSAYRKFSVQHGLCDVHHLRELAGIVQATEQEWATGLAELLVEILVAVNEAKDAGRTRLNKRVLRGYRRLVAEGIRLNPLSPPTGKRGRPARGTVGSLLGCLDANRDDVLRFASDFRVPFSNYEAERAIRMVKLQQKVSGSWRSWDGAEAFLAIRTYVGTARKQDANTLQALRDAFAGDPWLPATS